MTVYSYTNPRQHKEKSAGYEAGVDEGKLNNGHSNACFHRQHLVQ